jgi:predicted ATPase
MNVAQINFGKFRLKNIRIAGYRPFKDFRVEVNNLEVLVGANASGKSSLMEFLRFLRNSAYQEIPSEIIEGSSGMRIFHVPSEDRIEWAASIDVDLSADIVYSGRIVGPVGSVRVDHEKVETSRPLSKKYEQSFLYMELKNGEGTIYEPGLKRPKEQKIQLLKANQLALSTMNNPGFFMLYNLREYIQRWRFYNSFKISNEQLRRPSITEQEPTLHENASNLSAVLLYLQTEYPEIFERLKFYLGLMLPNFRNITVKARGGPGQVMAFWSEDSVGEELTLADLSDGTLRILCWAIICLHPFPPTLVFVDEPDQGIHPRVYPLLAELFKELSDKAQVILTTHSSYFLSMFDIENILVLNKEAGDIKALKPSTSQALIDNLKEFGDQELEIMHRSGEFEMIGK